MTLAPLQPTQSSAAPQPTAQTEPDPATAASNLASDFDTFLTLLTTQLKNQDPSKPFDSTEFVGQLASFSSVEQQIATNTKLDGLIASINGSAASGLAEWIGKGVLSDAPAVFTGEPMPVHYALPPDTSSASVLVYDSNNALVNRISVQPGSTQVTWDGLALDGSTMPLGEYRFEIETYEGTTLTGTQPAQSFSNVVEARLENGAPKIVFADGSSMLVDNIIAVRQAA